MTAQQYLDEHHVRHREWRRSLHQQPELAFQEHKTSDFICARLTEMGIPFVRGLGGTGRGGDARRQGRWSHHRTPRRHRRLADPRRNQSALSLPASGQGAMPAGMTATPPCCLLQPNTWPSSRAFKGRVRFIFQPAEEAEGGARKMIEEGLFRDFAVDAVFGLHNWPGLPKGRLAVKPGAVMASMDLFVITIRGKRCSCRNAPSGERRDRRGRRDYLLCAIHRQPLDRCEGGDGPVLHSSPRRRNAECAPRGMQDPRHDPGAFGQVRRNCRAAPQTDLRAHL